MKIFVFLAGVVLGAMAISSSASAWSYKDCEAKCRALNGAGNAEAMNWCLHVRQPTCDSFRGQPDSGATAVQRAVDKFREQNPGARYIPKKER